MDQSAGGATDTSYEVNPRKRRRLVPPMVCATVAIDFNVPDPQTVYHAAHAHLIRSGHEPEDAHEMLCLDGKTDTGECFRILFQTLVETVAKRAHVQPGDIDVFLEVDGKRADV